jgi:outer membrane protein
VGVFPSELRAHGFPCWQGASELALCAHPFIRKYEERLRLMTLAAAVAAMVATPCCAATFSLQDALIVAYQSNPQLEAARAGLRSVDEGVAQASAGRRPNISTSGSYGISQGNVQGLPGQFNSHPLVGQVTITQPVYSGGQTDARVGHAISEVHAGRAELAAREQSVLLAAVQAYMDVLRDEAALRLNRTNMHTLQSRLEAVQTQHSAGAVTRTDVDQARARLALAQSNVAAAELQIAASRAAFEAVIGRPAETLEDAPRPPTLPASRDAALALAVAENPTLVEAKAEVRASDFAVDDAVGAMLPQFSLSAQYQYLRDAAGTNVFATNSPQQNLAVVGQITIPIYQGGGEEAGVRRAKELRSQSQLAVATAERDVRQTVESAWQGVVAAQATLTSNRAQMQADEAAVDGVTQEQRGGERSVLDILNAQEEFLGAQIAVEASKHDVVVAAYRLLASTGQLTANALRLPVTLYDPQEHYDKTATAWFGLGN